MAKDDATWLNVAYVCFLVLASYVGFKALETVGIQTGLLERFEWYMLAATFAGLIIGVVASLILKGNAERHEYLLSSIAELRKVTWPSWQDTKRMTVIVCIVCGVFAVIVSAFDIVWAKLLRGLLA